MPKIDSATVDRARLGSRTRILQDIQRLSDKLATINRQEHEAAYQKMVGRCYITGNKEYIRCLRVQDGRLHCEYIRVHYLYVEFKEWIFLPVAVTEITAEEFAFYKGEAVKIITKGLVR